MFNSTEHTDIRLQGMGNPAATVAGGCLRQGVHGAVPFEETHMHHYVFWSRVLPDGLAVCGGCCRCPIRLANRPPLPLERALSAFQVWLSARRTLSPIFASHRLSSLQAEEDSSCRRILHKFFPETCLFTDVFGLVEDEPGRAELLDPQQVTWKQTCYCETHKRQCPVVFPRDTLLCLGAPCVLFSKLLASTERLCIDIARVLRQLNAHETPSVRP